MDNIEITFLFKAMNTYNKKFEIPLLDSYISFCNHEGKNYISMMDLNKIFIFENNLNIDSNFFISKSDILALKEKASKYFIKDINEDNVIFTVVNKNETKDVSVKKIKNGYKIPEILKKGNTVLFNNKFKIDANEFKKSIKNYEGNITLISSTEKLCDDSLISDGLYYYYPLNEEVSNLAELCPYSFEKRDNMRVSVSAEILDHVIAMYGLTKKKNCLYMCFNNKFLMITDGHISNYIRVKEAKDGEALESRL